MTQIKLILLLALALLAAPQSPSADLILHNGVIWTVDAKNPQAQAVAIENGKFVAVDVLYTIVDGKIVYESK